MLVNSPPINTVEGAETLTEWLIKAREKLRTTPSLLEAETPYHDVDVLPALNAYVKNDAVIEDDKELHRYGLYEPDKDLLSVMLHTKNRGKYWLPKTQSASLAHRNGTNKLISTLRHELSHRAQRNEGKPKNVLDLVLGSTAASQRALDYFGPELMDETDPDLWEDDPEEWLATADELGYMLRRNGVKPEDIRGAGITDVLHNLGNSSYTALYDNFTRHINDNTVNKKLWLNTVNKWLDRIKESYDIGETTISDERCKQMEQTALKAIEGMKGKVDLTAIVKQLVVEEGFTEPDVTEIVNNVLTRLKRTETRVKGQKLGVAHNPNKQYQTMVQNIQSMRY